MTTVWAVDPASPDPAAVAAAAAVLRAGGLVAFPTETVYGLGADALNPTAVAGIFAAKGRPSSNPLIVHLPDVGRIPMIAGWPPAAGALAAHFWPGPLTLVLPKRDVVPDAVTAGGPTVAVRIPDHPVARALLEAVDRPLAAPSANRSTQLSPTRAEHVLAGLSGRIAGVLDGGPCRGGLESTVVDVTGDAPRLLRPGLVTLPMLEAIVGPVRVGPAGDGAARSPGLMAKHYSPRTPVVLTDDASEADLRIGVELPADPGECARVLYDTLHRLDAERRDRIVIERPPDAAEWAAVRDRLTRAAS